jgi:alkanesulfonate monooxygenase SsuD/methylene tetrahydromethanopterin reductase-like flavin-dependent oxidoreductase (luciferase family)
MDVGHLILCCSDGWAGITDAQVYREEIQLARMADDLGYDMVWAAEHHFDGYSMVPDNMQVLAHLAGMVNRITLGTAAIILPWHDPLRVVESICVLDNLTDGRLRIGFGRGAARMEFNGFREGSMDESRERFDEAVDIIMRGLETGVIEGDGRFYKQPSIRTRPQPERSFKGRIYSVASSEDSLHAAARIGARLMMPADRTWKSRLPGINLYRDLYKEAQGEDAPRPLCTDYCLCLPDEDRVRDLARQFLGTMIDSTWSHYESKGDHFAATKGYERYQDTAAVLNRLSRDEFLDKVFLGACTWGTPDQILERLRFRHEMLGGFEMSTSFRFGGVPFDVAQESMTLFAEEVLPVLHTW